VATNRSRLRDVSVVPLAIEAAGPAGAAAGLIFGRPALCEPLGIDAFGRQHGLTPAECAVLTSLCNRQTPREIAEEREVAVCTVRTHVRSILEKSGTRSVSQLIRLTAMLPPVLSLAT
jgi:DNA-binding CsgD family transcriptional regulator